MRYEEIIALVVERTGLFAGQAVSLTRAILATLAERITGDEARELAARLPAPLQDALLPAKDDAEAFSVDEFVKRVAERSGLDPAVAETAVGPVMATLHDAVKPGEFADHVLAALGAR